MATHEFLSQGWVDRLLYEIVEEMDMKRQTESHEKRVASGQGPTQVVGPRHYLVYVHQITAGPLVGKWCTHEEANEIIRASVGKSLRIAVYDANSQEKWVW